MNPHATHIDKWIKANELSPSKVRWESYPIGMVQRWIERAEAAESQLVALQEQVKALSEALYGVQERAERPRWIRLSPENISAIRDIAQAALSQVPAQKEQDNG